MACFLPIFREFLEVFAGAKVPWGRVVAAFSEVMRPSAGCGVNRDICPLAGTGRTAIIPEVHRKGALPWMP
jgi:hypothetical protein